MWADLGDTLSQQYTGAASTMGAALRQGGHTARAMLEKGWRAVNRAYCAHFEDDARQAALQLLLGSHKLTKVPMAEIRRCPQGKLLVAVASWNLHGHPCWECPATLKGLIQGASTVNGEQVHPDIFELSASNVVLLSSGDEARQSEFEAKASTALNETGETFVPVRSVGMVGLVVAAFVASRLASSIRSVSAQRIRSGLYGQAGNKGAVAVTFQVEETLTCSWGIRACAVAVRLHERADQLREILHSLCRDKGADLVVLSGDFNFRANFPDASANPQALRKTLTGSAPSAEEVLRLFRESDELYSSRSQSRHALQETLKEGLGHGQAAYDLERQPAWCDRVLHSKVSVQRKSYCALGLANSDHRPVCAVLETLLLAMPQEAQSQKSPSPSRTPEAERRIQFSTKFRGWCNSKPRVSGFGARQLVYAKYKDGWFLANVTCSGSGLADVAWLRPSGDVWGDKAKMSRYLCSTNADETLHGDRLPIATHIRLPSQAHGQTFTVRHKVVGSFSGANGSIRVWTSNAVLVTFAPSSSNVVVSAAETPGCKKYA
eukprot:g29539.t1